MNRSLSWPVAALCLTIAFSFTGADDTATAQNKVTAKPEPKKVTAADMPRIPATEPKQVLETFRLAKGFSLELVASEPLLSDPVDACFDEFGRMFVAEMHGYPFSQEPTKLNPQGGGKKDAGIIRRLEDTNGDGRMDKSVIYADGISWPTSVRCFRGGVFVIAPKHLYYFKDTTGDGRADVREIVLSGFGRDNVQSVTNGLMWGLDNKIYFASGRNPKRLTHRGKPIKLSGGDLRFDPKTEVFESVSGGLQFGHTKDSWGVRFVCSNSNHIQQVLYPQHYVSRNPYFAVSGMVRSIAADGASARVFRISPPEPWRIIRQKWRAAAKGYKLVINDDGAWEFLPLDPTKKKGAVPTEYPVGYFTSATGITIYRGNAYPVEFRENAFVGDVGGNLVHRKTVDSSRALYSAKRADPGEEFVRSTDNWFRPVNFVNAPDGSLYVLDMYRETVEHPYSIPAEIKAFLKLTSGVDRGRVYRLVSPNMKRIAVPKLGNLNTIELVGRLASENGWERDTAQRLLWERGDASVAPQLEELLNHSTSAFARMHALYALSGLGQLEGKHVLQGLDDSHPRVQAHAIKLSEPLLAKSELLVEKLLELCGETNDHIRFQLAFTLGQVKGPASIKGLAELARAKNLSNEVQTAILSSVGDSADLLASALLQGPSSAQSNSMLSRLAIIVGAQPSPATTAKLLRATAQQPSISLHYLVFSGVHEGLSRRGSSLHALLASQSENQSLQDGMKRVFDKAVAMAGDESLPLSQRNAGVVLLSFADFDTAKKELPDLLAPQTPQLLQRSAVAALSAQPAKEALSLLFAGWKNYSPQVRRDIVDSATRDAGRLELLLAAVENKTIRPSEIERSVKQMVSKHRNAALRKRSVTLFGSATNADRAKVVAAYQDALNLSGDRTRGLAVFKKNCATCHQVGDVGKAVAPNLTSVKNKSTADLLIAILDPNREAQPNFNVYTVVTMKGRIHNGIIASESANSLTLRRAEAKEDVILRSNIDELVATGVSLMPEGLEKDLSRQDLADVMSFIKSINADSTSK